MGNHNLLIACLQARVITLPLSLSPCSFSSSLSLSDDGSEVSIKHPGKGGEGKGMEEGGSSDLYYQSHLQGGGGTIMSNS